MRDIAVFIRIVSITISYNNYKKGRPTVRSKSTNQFKGKCCLSIQSYKQNYSHTSIEGEYVT